MITAASRSVAFCVSMEDNKNHFGFLDNLHTNVCWKNSLNGKKHSFWSALFLSDNMNIFITVKYDSFPYKDSLTHDLAIRSPL